MRERIRKVLLWLWPKIRAVYARCELQVDLLDLRRFLAGVAGPSERSAAAEPAALTAISGAHAHGESRGARVPGGHVLLIALLCAVTAQAAPSPDSLNAVHNAFRGASNPFRMGEPLDPQGGGSQSGPAFRFDGSYNLLVNCITGCSASSGFTDNSSFTVGTSTINPLGAYYTSGSAPSISSGNAGRVRMDSNSYLFVDCVVGCSGGSFNNNSDGVATSSTNGQTAAWLYGFNGTTWDRLRDDTNKYLYVDVANSSLAVTGTFWQTTQPVSCTAANCLLNVTQWDSTALGIPTAYGTAPTTGNYLGVNAYITNTPAVSGSGNFTVVQGTGSNLHMVCDSGCSSSAGFADNSAFTVGTTAINPIGGLYDTGADPSISNGNAGRARIDSHSYLLVDGSQVTQPVSGTFWQATQPVSGTFWQSTQPVSIADGSSVTLGSKADAKSTATDTTAITAMQVWKEISAMEQAPASRAVTNAGTFAVQPSSSGSTGSGVPSVASYSGGNGSGNLTGQIMCDSTVIKNALASSGVTLLVAAPGSSKNVYICGFTVNGASTTLNTVKLVYGTHTTTDCDTGATAAEISGADTTNFIDKFVPCYSFNTPCNVTQSGSKELDFHPSYSSELLMYVGDCTGSSTGPSGTGATWTFAEPSGEPGGYALSSGSGAMTVTVDSGCGGNGGVIAGIRSTSVTQSCQWDLGFYDSGSEAGSTGNPTSTAIFSQIGNVVAVRAWAIPGATVSGVSDGTDTFTAASNPAMSDSDDGEPFFFYNTAITAAGAQTITATLTGTRTHSQVAYQEFVVSNGCTASHDVDSVAGTDSGTPSMSVNTPAFTPTPGDVAYGFSAVESHTTAANSPWLCNERWSDFDSSIGDSGSCWDVATINGPAYILSTSGTETNNMTQLQVQTWQAILISFKLTGSGGGGTTIVPALPLLGAGVGD